MAEEEERPSPTEIKAVRDAMLPGLMGLGLAANAASNEAPGRNPAADALQQDHKEFLGKLRRDLMDLYRDLGSKTPADVLDRALTGLSEIEQRRFVAQNLLEAIKAGRSVRETISRYRQIGLVEFSPEEIVPGEAPGVHLAAPDQAWLKPITSMVRRIMSGLTEAALRVMHIVVAVIRTSPKFFGIKPSVGLAAGLPTISFEFEAQAVTIDDFFKKLSEHVPYQVPT